MKKKNENRAKISGTAEWKTDFDTETLTAAESANWKLRMPVENPNWQLSMTVPRIGHIVPQDATEAANWQFVEGSTLQASAHSTPARKEAFSNTETVTAAESGIGHTVPPDVTQATDLQLVEEKTLQGGANCTSARKERKRDETEVFSNAASAETTLLPIVETTANETREEDRTAEHETQKSPEIPVKEQNPVNETQVEKKAALAYLAQSPCVTPADFAQKIHSIEKPSKPCALFHSGNQATVAKSAEDPIDDKEPPPRHYDPEFGMKLEVEETSEETSEVLVIQGGDEYAGEEATNEEQLVDTDRIPIDRLHRMEGRSAEREPDQALPPHRSNRWWTQLARDGALPVLLVLSALLLWLAQKKTNGLKDENKEEDEDEEEEAPRRQ